MPHKYDISATAMAERAAVAEHANTAYLRANLRLAEAALRLDEAGIEVREATKELGRACEAGREARNIIGEAEALMALPPNELEDIKKADAEAMKVAQAARDLKGDDFVDF